ncbi:MAG: ABC-F family ATP-binding cassette domain-containing protein [Thermoanaerobaculia bacterium]
MMGRHDVWEAIEERERILPTPTTRSSTPTATPRSRSSSSPTTATARSQGRRDPRGVGILTRAPRADACARAAQAARAAGPGTGRRARRPAARRAHQPPRHPDHPLAREVPRRLPGCALVISHDHRFLDNVVTHILDVDYETILVYHGNYTKFTESKVEERDRKEAEIEKREAEIAHHKEFIDRFKAKATKARQAKSKMKLIERIVIDKLPQSSRRYPLFKFSQRRPSGKEVLRIEEVSKAYGENQVLKDVSLTVQRGDRLAILGPNGIGKSTLLKIAMNVVAADSGKMEWGYETWPGYFAQDHREAVEESEQSVEAWFYDLVPSETISFVRGKLAEVLFQREEVEKPLRALSGGEAARLVFAKLSVQKPNVLILDEPTNHLDLEAIEALVEGLEAYDGTLIFVSHDRWFVSKLATRILEISPAGIRDFAGSYDEYVERCGDDHLDAEVVLARARQEKKRENAKRAAAPASANGPGNVRALSSRRDKLTADIEKAESRVHAINEMFCNPGFFDKTPAPEVRRLEEEQKSLTTKIDAWMAEWARLEEELSSTSV